MEEKGANQETVLISDNPNMTDGDKALLKRKLMKFVCGTCDAVHTATPEQIEALPEITALLLLNF